MRKKKIIFIELLFVSVLSFGQSFRLPVSETLTSSPSSIMLATNPPQYSTGRVIRITDLKENTDEERNTFLRVEEEYDTANYFAVYLAIQTSSVTKAQTKLVKEMTLLVKKNGGVLYTVIQSGVPPPICGLPGLPPCK